MEPQVELPKTGDEPPSNLTAKTGDWLYDGDNRRPLHRPVDPPIPPAIRWREIFSILLIVAVADITIFRGGYSGIAVCLLVVPCLMLLGYPAAKFSTILIGLGTMIALLAARLVWQGSLVAVLVGFLLVSAFAQALSGYPPFVFELLGFIAKSWIDAINGCQAYFKWLRYELRHAIRLFSLQWILPCVAVVAFGGLFIAANPDLAETVRLSFNRLMDQVRYWLETFSSSPGEGIFCLVVGWYTLGMFRQSHWSQEALTFFTLTEGPKYTGATDTPKDRTLFIAYRNTLVSVSVLFAVYLVFEFQTLWFRTFPKGFHYSGYAHQGAAWLTVALALATVVLSIIFRSRTLQYPGVGQLRRWAWIWSVENFILALAVYNRVWIYIGFNGMTRMRVVALLGISSVVIGFLLVLQKIARHKGVLWLVRRQLLTVTLAAYLYVVIPVDWLVYSYNVKRILGGDLAPAVQITEHELSPEAILTLPPLLNSSDPIIRNGIRSLIVNHVQALGSEEFSNPDGSWMNYQLVDVCFDRRIADFSNVLGEPNSEDQRNLDWNRFREYVYQWY